MIGPSLTVTVQTRPAMSPRRDGLRPHSGEDGFARVLQEETGSPHRGKPDQEVAVLDASSLLVAPSATPLEMAGGGAAPPPCLPHTGAATRTGVSHNEADLSRGGPPRSARWPSGQVLQAALDKEDTGAELKKVVVPASRQASSGVMDADAMALDDAASLVLDDAAAHADIDGAVGVSAPEAAAVAPDKEVTADTVSLPVLSADAAPELPSGRPAAETVSPARQILNLLMADLGSPNAVAPFRTLKVMLKPEHLGEVEIIVRSDAAGGLRIRIETQLQEAADRLLQDRRQIGTMLEALGIPLAEGGVTITARPGTEALPTEVWRHGHGSQDSLMHPHGQSPRDGNDSPGDSRRGNVAAGARTEVTTDESHEPSPPSHVRRDAGRFV